MNLDTNNEVVKLCIDGIQQESNDINIAKDLYQKAWNNAHTDYEKCIAAHYLARNQNIDTELKWNAIALEHAMQVTGVDIKGILPSLYLNLGKSYETSGQLKEAVNAYDLAKENSIHLNDDGYGKMILSGINNALSRIRKRS